MIVYRVFTNCFKRSSRPNVSSQVYQFLPLFSSSNKPISFILYYHTNFKILTLNISVEIPTEFTVPLSFDM